MRREGEIISSDPSELAKALKQGEVLQASDLAKAHVGNAIRTLDRCMDIDGDEEVPWAVKRGAAKDMIEIAEGRSAVKELEKIDASFTLVINKLTIGAQDVSRVITPTEVKRALEQADAITIETEDGRIGGASDDSGSISPQEDPPHDEW